MDTLLIERLSDHYQQHAKASELSPVNGTDVIFSKEEAITVSSQEWEKAKFRESVIKPLALLSICSLDLVKESAKQLNVSWRQVYKLVHRYRNSGNKLTSLLPLKRLGGKNQDRLGTVIESIIKATIEEFCFASIFIGRHFCNNNAWNCNSS